MSGSFGNQKKWLNCSETASTGESQFHISTPLGIELGSLMMRSKKVNYTGPVELWSGCTEIAGSPQRPPSSRLCWLWIRKEDLQQTWIQNRRAVWDQVGLSHCQYDGLVTVRDEAHLRRGHNDQTHWGHQRSETKLTGESRFHTSSHPGDWTRVTHDGKQTGEPLDQWNCKVDAVRLQALHKICIPVSWKTSACISLNSFRLEIYKVQ